MPKTKKTKNTFDVFDKLSLAVALTGMNQKPDALARLIKVCEEIKGEKIFIELDTLKLSDSERRQRLGERVRWMRHGAQLKQSELAEKIGVTKAAIAAYEEGRSEPNLRNVIALSRALGVRVGWLLGEETLSDDARILI